MCHTHVTYQKVRWALGSAALVHCTPGLGSLVCRRVTDFFSRGCVCLGREVVRHTRLSCDWNRMHRESTTYFLVGLGLCVSSLLGHGISRVFTVCVAKPGSGWPLAPLVPFDEDICKGENHQSGNWTRPAFSCWQQGEVLSVHLQACRQTGS